ncbi:MAG: hypothetical protein H7263_04270 [Candidatus Sericytochromatia bacterium]|nr:hypothetical protein [Candidatus Sericytochromatia bacterium]
MKKVVKKVVIHSIITSLTLSISHIAKAEMVDAKSIALGGTTIGLADNAFAPLRNPAAMVDLGWGSFILPLSPAFSFGNNVGSFSAASDLFKGNNNNSNTSFFDNLSNNSNSRIDIQGFLPLIGYSGKPFKNAIVMGKPIALGINIWGRAVGSANLNLSKGLAELISNYPSLISSVQNIQQSLSLNSLSNLANLKIPDINKFSSFDTTNKAAINAVADEVEMFQKDTLQPAILQSDTLITSISQVGNNIKTILGKFDDLSKNSQSGKGSIVADGHAVVAVSGASRIFKNEHIDLSVGLNLKGFFFPVNTSANNFFGSNSSSNNLFGSFLQGQNNNARLLPINLNTNLQLGSFKSIDEIKGIIDNQVFSIINGGQDLIKSGKELDNQLNITLPKVRQNIANAIGDIPNLQRLSNDIQSQSNSLNQKISANSSSKITNDILNSLSNDLGDVKLNYSQMTDVSTFGFGVDLGIQAKIVNDLTLGIVFENPLVLWPAKIKNNQATFDTTQFKAGAGSQKFDLNNILKISEDANPKSANYNLSEPFAIRAGGAYALGKLTPYLSNATILADIEQVFNDRPFALHLGFEKAWHFSQTTGTSVRIGTQLGGLGNMITFGIGGRNGPFNVSLGFGTGNLFNPINSNSAVAGLSTSLDF